MRAAVLRGLDDRVKDALVTFPSTVVRTILEEYTETMAGKAVEELVVGRAVVAQALGARHMSGWSSTT